MIYCDTSLVVTSITSEAQTGAAQRWLAEHKGDGLCASLWVGTEVASALAQKQRGRLLNDAQREAAYDRWRRMSADWSLLAIEPDDFRRAADLTRRGLRAGDALHLAVALQHGTAMATRDDHLARASRELELVTYRPA